MVTGPVDTGQAARTGSSRLGWLDALRGIGALAVVGEHLTTWAMPWLRPTAFNAGMYGVLVFFLVSGYIIPRSLERHGDLRTFWIGRVFRLYPLYLAVIGLMLVLTPWIALRVDVPRDASAVAAHATMLMDVVGMGAVLNTMWTLSYEMVFYLVVCALFVAGVRDGRGWLPVLFALAGVVAGVGLAGPPLSGVWPVWVSAAGFALGLACVLSGRGARPAAVVMGVMALVLLLSSSRVPWFGAAMLAFMFAGTAVHRWERGQGRLWPVFVAGAMVALTPVWAISAGWWWVRPPVWILTIVLAALTFAGAMALRGRRLPAVLVRLGVISYSLYLVHLPILLIAMRVLGEMRFAPWPGQLGVGVLVLGVLLPVSWLTYRYVELPMQRAGRRLSGRAGGMPSPA